MDFKPVLSALASRPAFAAFGLVAGLFVSAQIGGIFAKPPPPPGIAVRAEAPRSARDWLTVTVPCPEGGIVALRPSSNELAAVAERYGLPDLLPVPVPGMVEAKPSPFRLFGKDAPATLGDRKILNAFAVPKMPWGGEGLATLRPDGVTDVHLIAASRPRFELSRQWGMGAMVGMSDVDTFGERWRTYLFVEPLRVGSVYVRGEVGLESRNGASGWYALAGLEWKRK